MSNTQIIRLQGDPNQWSVAITRETIQRILKNPTGDTGDMLALWMFYAYTARWQHTNRPKSVTEYTAKGLGWSVARVRRAKSELAKLGLIADSKTTDGNGRITGWYVEVFYLALAQNVHPHDFPQGGNTGDKYSRSGSLNALAVNKTKSSLKPSPPSDGVGFKRNEIEYDANWKPDSRSKEQKLRTIKPPVNCPSEREFEEFMENEGFTHIPNKREDLYRRLCAQKWHQWKSAYRKWVPIRNWQAYVAGLENKMDDATTSTR